MHAVESPPEPLRRFITGGAGTDKSHVISVVHEHFERAQIGDGCACMLIAPTGVAAFNIGGLTIHKALFWVEFALDSKLQMISLCSGPV